MNKQLTMKSQKYDNLKYSGVILDHSNAGMFSVIMVTPKSGCQCQM
jgi:hypothetical protein